MANWRRERVSVTVHLVVDDVPTSVCGVDRDDLGATLWDTAQVGQALCVSCSRALLTAADAAIAAAERVGERKDVAATTVEGAKQAARYLASLVPGGETRDLVLYARACLARNGAADATRALETWRAQMRVIGVLPAA